MYPATLIGRIVRDEPVVPKNLVRRPDEEPLSQTVNYRQTLCICDDGAILAMVGDVRVL
jgi:hypothetical protein